MKVVLSGSSGLVGSALRPVLAARGHGIVRLVRGASGAGAARWDPDAGVLDPDVLRGADAVVHLGGENIASGRWTAARKARILDSRVRGTAVLARAMAALERKPGVFVCASGVNFYGDRGDELVDERTGPGRGFLADVCRQWEAATQPAADAGVRVVNARLGPVFSGAGGALQKMLPPFRLGVGGAIGSGRQYMSWIAIDDVVEAIVHLLSAEAVRGPVNLVAPNPVTNLELTKTIGVVVRRPAVMRVPASVLRLVLGEMADEMLLGGVRAMPARLLESGYRFRYPTLEGALRHVLGRG